ncbi:MAG TPA: OmpA family protein [Cyclobacteriaceae bacterium]|nr:OmpA family protein [Cyclobacteriaceae bacterium]
MHIKSSILILLLIGSISAAAQVLSQQALQVINSAYDEQSPVLSPDGKLLFFTVCNHPLNIGGKRDPGDIWFSEWKDGHWTAPQQAGALLNDRAYNAVAGFSADGSQVFLLNHYGPAGTVAATQGISVSKKVGGGWSRPENISIPYFQNKSSLQSGYISADGSAFVYAAETYGTKGVEDIYVSLKNPDGKWQQSINLGSQINTKMQELSPSLSPDTRTLYFSTNSKGNGSFDVYSATRLDDSWTNWSEPVNMGPEINTTGRELFFKDYSGSGFYLFTTTSNSDRYGNLKVYVPDVGFNDSTIIAVAPKTDTIVKINENKYENLADNMIRVHGRLTNSKNGDPVSGKMIFQSAGKTITADAYLGEYSLPVESGNVYSITIDAPGYVNGLESLDLKTYELKDLEMNFQMQPIEVGTTVTLKNILFVQSKDALLPDSYPQLDLVVQFMKANPHVEIELSGHTDSRGSFRQLMSLSQKRVNRVKNYLVSKGIKASRITGKGYGGSKPVASNETEETRLLNRRVEFTIKKL